jgi:hypothetical protein
LVSRRGYEIAVLVPIEQWRRLQDAARPSLKQLLLVPEARMHRLVPPRGDARRRRKRAPMAPCSPGSTTSTTPISISPA